MVEGTPPKQATAPTVPVALSWHAGITSIGDGPNDVSFSRNNGHNWTRHLILCLPGSILQDPCWASLPTGSLLLLTWHTGLGRQAECWCSRHRASVPGFLGDGPSPSRETSRPWSPVLVAAAQSLGDLLSTLMNHLGVSCSHFYSPHPDSDVI